MYRGVFGFILHLYGRVWNLKPENTALGLVVIYTALPPQYFNFLCDGMQPEACTPRVGLQLSKWLEELLL